MGTIQMHTEANLTLRKKVKMSIYDHRFCNFGRPPVSDYLYKDLATRHPRTWRSRFVKVFTIYGHGSHLGQWTATILAIFYSPAPGRLQIKFEQHWPWGSRGEVIWNSQHFPIQKGKQTWPHRKKVKCQCVTTILAVVIDLSSLIIYAKIQPQGFLGSGEEDFLKIFTIYGHGGHFG